MILRELSLQLGLGAPLRPFRLDQFLVASRTEVKHGLGLCSVLEHASVVTFAKAILALHHRAAQRSAPVFVPNAFESCGVEAFSADHAKKLVIAVVKISHSMGAVLHPTAVAIDDSLVYWEVSAKERVPLKNANLLSLSAVAWSAQTSAHIHFQGVNSFLRT